MAKKKQYRVYYGTSGGVLITKKERWGQWLCARYGGAVFEVTKKGLKLVKNTHEFNPQTLQIPQGRKVGNLQ